MLSQTTSGGLTRPATLLPSPPSPFKLPLISLFRKGHVRGLTREYGKLHAIVGSAKG